MSDNKMYWYFLRKVNERLTILFQHKIPNHIDLDETDEELLKELYEMHCTSDLFIPSEEELSAIDQSQHDIFAEKNNGLLFVTPE